MIISIYIHKMNYKFGGTESYTAKFLEVMQDLYPNAKIALITECFNKGDELSELQLIERMNNGYGTLIKPDNFSVRYIFTKEPYASKNIFERIKRKYNLILFQKKLCTATKNDDLFVNCSNQAVIASAKRNITIIHFPQDRREYTGIYKRIPFLRPIARSIDKRYLNCYECFLPNSNFTADWLKQKWQLQDKKIHVSYPLVTPILLQYKKNPMQIAVCGRIEASKKIDVMVKAFNSSEFLKKNCVLKIAGSCDNEERSYIDYIKSLSDGNVQIELNPSRSQLEELYAESGIFWHAKGYGETNPMLMEHFGMTTIEAMSAGCIPVVINKGGQQEIVTADCGFTWDVPEQLVEYTEKLLGLSDEKIAGMRASCIERSKMCSKETFKNHVKELLGL